MELLRQMGEEYGISLSGEQLSQFRVYEELLLQWNRKINLTAIVEHEEVCIKHFLDSLLLQKAVRIPEEGKVIDVGTGAGFPGIPLKIASPGIRLTLLDSLQKRINFLREVSTVIGAAETCCIHGRAEDVARDPAHREQYDVACARAVASLPALAELCLPYVKVGGVFVALKGPDVEEEVRLADAALSLLGGELEGVERENLPNQNRRTFVVIRKRSQTPPKYPRKGTKIQKFPL